MSTMLDNLAPDVDLEKEIPEEEVEIQAETTVEPPPEKEEVVPVKSETQQPRVDLVSQKALHEARASEREWRDKAQRAEREGKERFQKLEARLNALVNPPTPVPKFEENPAEHLRHQMQQTQTELANIRQLNARTQSLQQQAAFEQQISQTTQASEVDFAKEHPDYLDAIKHLQGIADKNLEMMGITDPAARTTQIRKDALAMSVKALQMGKSPAEVAYQLAQNYGYKSPADTTERKIKALQAGQNAGAMPSGGTQQSALTLATLEQMDDEDFNKLIDDPSTWKKLIRQMV